MTGFRAFDKLFAKKNPRLANHVKSKRHRGATESWHNPHRDNPVLEAHELPAVCQRREKERKNNRACLKKVALVVGFLAGNGIAFRGHDEKEASNNRGNFLELVDMFLQNEFVKQSVEK